MQSVIEWTAQARDTIFLRYAHESRWGSDSYGSEIELVDTATSIRRKCPLCKNALIDGKEYEHLLQDLDNRAAQKHAIMSRKQKKNYEATLGTLRSKYLKEIQTLKKDFRDQQKTMKRMLSEQVRKEREKQKRKLVSAKKTYQTQLRNIREIYDREILFTQKEQEHAFNTQLKEIIQNYGNLGSSHQKEVERLKKQDDLNDVLMKKKDREIMKLKIEMARSSSKLREKDLAMQVSEKNMVIEKLNEKIQELETGSRASVQSAPIRPETRQARKTQTAKLDEDEQKQKLKEYMKAIIEITRNQQQAEKKLSDSADQGIEETKHESSSKVDKKLGWFA